MWRDGRRAEHRAGEYLQVRVSINGRRCYTTAHRLVWHALKSSIPSGMFINHKNGIKDDNRPENLELATPSQNIRHAHASGLIDQRGQKNPASKLTDRQVSQIRLAYADGSYTQAHLAEKFGVSFQAISKIVRGDRRKLQGGPTADYASRRKWHALRDPKGRIAGRVREMPEVLRG